MATWRQYQLGARVRGLDFGMEERLALDRSAARDSGPRASGRLVNIRTYRRPQSSTGLSCPQIAPDVHLARPLELVLEGEEVLVVRELSFGPSLADVISGGPQSEAVVAAIVLQLLEGLAVLHGTGRAHLRLSPDAVRFDLLGGALKIGDLEEAGLIPDPRADLIPRFLEPDVRVGLVGPATDIYSVGRLGEALLRGAAPLGSWGVPPANAPTLWPFLLRCQGSAQDGRPVDGTAALTALRGLGIAPAGGAMLPLGKFVRTHVAALRELRRWRAQPLPALPEVAGSSYRMVLSSSQAAKLWGMVGGAAATAILLSVHLAGLPARSAEAALKFEGDGCVDDVHASVVADAKAAPDGYVVATLTVPPEASVAVDGCVLAAVTPGKVLLAVEPGVHDLRAAFGNDLASVKLDAKGVIPAIDLSAAARPRGDGAAALALLAGHLMKPASDERAPAEVGLLEPVVRHLLAVDGAKVERDPGLRASLPDGVALALDGLRAAERRLETTAAPCNLALATAVDAELAPRPGTPKQQEADDGAERRATAILTVTRISGPLLSDPLKVESDALSTLGVTPGRRMLSAVARLAERPELTTCLAALSPKVKQVDELAAVVLAQIPGLPEEPSADDDSTE